MFPMTVLLVQATSGHFMSLSLSLLHFPPDMYPGYMLAVRKVLCSFSDLVKVQNVIRGSFKKRLEIVVRQVDGENMRDILKECKTKKWRNLLVDLNVDDTGLFLKMVSLRLLL